MENYFCKAPWNSLYFGMNGRITVCCFNREYILGNYPKDSIKSVLSGSFLENIREKTSVGDFSLCQNCNTYYQQTGERPAAALNYDELSLNENAVPSIIEFELSNTCNLECIMCSPLFSSAIARRQGVPAFPDVYGDTFIDELGPLLSHLKLAKFFGGAPFLIPQYKKIWALLTKNNPECKIFVQTSAHYLDQQSKDILEQGRFDLSVSMDSFNKQSYELIRKNASFEGSMENYDYLYNYAKRKGSFSVFRYAP